MRTPLTPPRMSTWTFLWWTSTATSPCSTIIHETELCTAGTTATRYSSGYCDTLDIPAATRILWVLQWLLGYSGYSSDYSDTLGTPAATQILWILGYSENSGPLSTWILWVLIYYEYSDTLSTHILRVLGYSEYSDTWTNQPFLCKTLFELLKQGCQTCGPGSRSGPWRVWFRSESKIWKITNTLYSLWCPWEVATLF